MNDIVSCALCTHAADAGQYTLRSRESLPCCWDCKKAEAFSGGWIVFYVEASRATGGVYLSGRNLDTSDRLFRAFRWDMSTSLNDSRYNFSKVRFVDENARRIFERLLKKES